MPMQNYVYVLRHATLIGLVAAMATPVIAETKRDLDPHTHGVGVLNIAIENTSVAIELDVPGHDIVGFERTPANDQEKAAIEAAKATLAKPLELFQFPDAAGCTVGSADVAYKTEADHDHMTQDAKAKKDHDHKHDKKAKKHDHDHDKKAKKHDHDHDKKAEAGDAHEGEEHAEFTGRYQLTCTKPDQLAKIDIRFFERFAGSEKLVVTVVTPKGQTQKEVGRAAPVIELGTGS